MTKVVKVNSRKYDNSIHKTWSGELIYNKNDLVKIDASFKSSISHQHLGLIENNTKAVEYFWFKKWFNIFRFHTPDGSLRNWYCNICMPPTLNGHILDYIDLDIDLLIWPDLSYEVLDEEEFYKNARLYSYSKSVLQKTHESIAEILTMIERKDPIFAERE